MNYENFCKVLAHIETHPEEHEQNKWCGTACCIAGHAYSMAKRISKEQRAEVTFVTMPFFQAALQFLGMEREASFNIFDEPQHWLFHSRRTIEDFQLVRYVEGTRRLMALAAKS